LEKESIEGGIAGGLRKRKEPVGKRQCEGEKIKIAEKSGKRKGDHAVRKGREKGGKES